MNLVIIIILVNISTIHNELDTIYHFIFLWYVQSEI